MAIFVLLSLGAVAFLYYQNQQLKGMLASYQATPTPLVSPEPSAEAETANWKTYTNQEFSFKYPADWLISGKKISSPSADITLWAFGSTDPMYNECMKLDKTDVVNNLKIKTYSRVIGTEACSGGDAAEMEKWIVKTDGEGYAPGVQLIYKSTKKTEAENIFDQILSTFKFNEASASASPTPKITACTQEAKLCPDGSSVSRTGPNCEFTACPSSY